MRPRRWLELRKGAMGIACLLSVACSTQGGGEKEERAAAHTGGAAGGDPALPGIAAADAKLTASLQAAPAAKGPDYRPRTRHLHPDGKPKYTNRLILETSPYLLQHAHNPVNWFAWGDEPFERARRQGRPVLLSVGYSTCHWCHVMEEESFEDEEIARILNEKYVAIKVDREVRPDVDTVYMAAVQRLSGSGGWPMTVWLTPERKPYFGGTYFPPRDGDRGARPGFLTLLQRLAEVYSSQPDRVVQAAEEITADVQAQLAPAAGAGVPRVGVLDDAAAFYESRFDRMHGGLQGGPKFPSGMPVRFLLRQHRRTGESRWLDMAVRTLAGIAAGGIHDQIGGGFHRYATDSRWLVPHFEKMLYDNALLAVVYLEAYQITGRDDFAGVVRGILRWAERDMSAPEGGFYSATDADSPAPDGRREEGWFFTWTPVEIEAALGAERARIVRAYCGVTAAGNFEGRNILHVARPPAEVATELRIAPATLAAALESAREELYAVRARRPPPLRDEKILAAWNGLMIGAFARAALVLDEPRYARRAERAADFVLTKLRQGDRLRRSYKDGRAPENAYLDDYAFLVAGLLDLYEAAGASRWLQEALRLDAVLEEHYEDSGRGGFFMTSADHERLLAREKPSYDGAEPSGNSVAAMNLLRLHELTSDDRYRQRAERLLREFGGILARSPAALAELLLAVDFWYDTPKEIAIVSPGSREDARAFLDELRTAFLPNRVLIVAAGDGDRAAQEKLVPLLAGKVAQGGKTTAYVCENRVCALPTADPVVFAAQIRRARSGKVSN